MKSKSLKRILTIILTGAMVLGSSVTALADDSTGDFNIPVTMQIAGTYVVTVSSNMVINTLTGDSTAAKATGYVEDSVNGDLAATYGVRITFPDTITLTGAAKGKTAKFYRVDETNAAAAASASTFGAACASKGTISNTGYTDGSTQGDYTGYQMKATGSAIPKTYYMCGFNGSSASDTKESVWEAFSTSDTYSGTMTYKIEKVTI